MSRLTIYKDTDSTMLLDTSNDAEIREHLAGIGVKFERWHLESNAAHLNTPAAILTAYKDSIQQLKQERGFLTEDVVAITPETPNHPELRRKFLAEHTHSDDEARFFVGGSGQFCIHTSGQVYSIICEKGDLINVPAGATHWFDMGKSPRFQCIRIFTDEAGWVADFTGSDIAEKFPRFDDLIESAV
ncbi:MAG: acireductone dioxygenase [Leptospiraceae bacterium]|nr:acireductone dioxygenase [Leptospiraceae bacterium]